VFDEADRLLEEEDKFKKKQFEDPETHREFLRGSFLEDIREMFGWTDVFPSVSTPCL